LSARSKRTATRTPSPGKSTSSATSSKGVAGTARASPSRTASRTSSSPSSSTSPSSSGGTSSQGGQATARASPSRTASRTPSTPSRTTSSRTTPTPSVSPTVSPSSQEGQVSTPVIIMEPLMPVETIPPLIPVDIPIETIPIPEITFGKMWMSFGFKSAVSNQTINFVTELQPVCDACDINSFWAQSHFNNSDPNQNFVKLHEDVVTRPSQVLSLDEAKALMLTLVPAVIPPLEPEIFVTPTQMPNISWVSISPGVFNLENNRVTGEMLFIAQSDFGSDFYNEPINSITQIKSLDGVNLISPKFNTLNFTETERDERIQINETAGGQTSVIVELFAWTQQGLAVATSKSFTVNLEDPAQIPAVAKAPGKMFNQIIAGLFMGGVALAFMGGLKGKKKKK